MSEENKGSEAKAGGSKMTVMLTVLNTVISLAMVGILFVSLKKEQSTQKVEDIVAEEGHDAGGGGHGAPAGGGGHGAPAAGGHGAPAAASVPGYGKMVTLDQFTINLTTPGSTTPKYVRVSISIEIADASVESEIGQKMPQVRNAIIDIFNSKRPGDLVHSEGRDYLKEEIRAAINGFMVTGKVKGIFFTNFALSS